VRWGWTSETGIWDCSGWAVFKSAVEQPWTQNHVLVKILGLGSVGYLDVACLVPAQEADEREIRQVPRSLQRRWAVGGGWMRAIIHVPSHSTKLPGAPTPLLESAGEWGLGSPLKCLSGCSQKLRSREHVPNPSRVESYPLTLTLFISFILLEVRSRSRVTFIVNFMCQEADAERR
jgi:hypothetical protein